jgi:hypothetical protein
MNPNQTSKPKVSGYGYSQPFAQRRDSSEMVPRRRKSSNSLNNSEISNGSRGSNRSVSKLSASSKNRHVREDSIEIRRKRLQQKNIREKQPLIQTSKGKPVDEVKKLDDEIEEIDAKFNRLKNLMNMTGANATFSKP